MKKNLIKKCAVAAAACAVIAAGVGYYYFFSSMSKDGETHYVYVDDDDNIDSVYTKLSDVSASHSLAAFKRLTNATSYASHVRTGRYAIEPSTGALQTFRHMRNGQQTPVNLTVPSVRTLDKLAAELSKRLMVDSADIAKALTSEATCEKYGYDTATIACMFIPNTYDIYWNTSVEHLLDRMQKESKRFWEGDRTVKAQQMKLTPNEVITLASIVDEETANNSEKPMIAGMYFNRLKKGMPLQADPTIKFALKDFALRRIYHKLLTVDSPYNTYKNQGLPPGPIKIASVAGIDAVLNYVHHDYLYMCAKEDFSGTHNFAVTYAEHLQNAAKYTKALNNRGIK